MITQKDKEALVEWLVANFSPVMTDHGIELIVRHINHYFHSDQQSEYWQQRCEAAEAYLIAMKNWFEKELSLQGFDEFSKSYDYWQQLKDQNTH